MGKTVSVQLTIPMDPDDRMMGRSFRFRRWLPLGIENGLLYGKGDVACRYWVDEKCVGHAMPFDPAEVSKYSTLFVFHVYATATTTVDDDLGNVIVRLTEEKQFTHANLDSTYGQDALKRHDQFAVDIYSVALDGFNKLVAHCRARKGQHWLTEKDIDPGNISSHLHNLKARVQVDGGEWKSFQVAKTGITIGCWGLPDEQCGVSQEDWRKIEQLVNSEHRPELVGTLLAQAAAMRVAGHTRAALIESVSALETAVSKFVTKAKTDGLALNAERFGVANIKAHRKHLGFTCTISYLFPMIFSEDQVSTKTLVDCRAAIEERNRVVHDGQRGVQDEKLARYLWAVRSLCEFLLSQCPEDEW